MTAQETASLQSVLPKLKVTARREMTGGTEEK